MRISCPNCDAQYEVDDAVIPEAGRDVQCSNCGQTWFQPGAPATTPPPATSAAPEPAPSDDHAEPQQDIAQDDHPAQAADAVQDDQTPQPDEAPEEPAPSPAPADAPEAEAASEPEPAAEEEPVAEPEAELVAEAPEAEEDDDAPEQSLRRRGLDAAVADVLGTLSVAVVITRTQDAGTPSSCAHTAIIFVWSPCPISVPPWLSCTEPSE